MEKEFDWKAAVKDIESFNEFYKSFDVLRKASTADQIRKAFVNYTNPFESGIYNTLVPITGSSFKTTPAWAVPTQNNTNPEGFYFWYTENYKGLANNEFKTLSSKAKTLISWVDYVYKEDMFSNPDLLEEMELFYNTKDPEKLKQIFISDTNNFLLALKAYAQVIQNMLNDIYPERFTYESFPIHNPDRLAKPLVHELLGGIRFLISFFKDRKLEKILREGITFFQLELSDDLTESAYFTIAEKSITICSGLQYNAQEPGRFMTTWAKEVFIHELGHYIHIYYLSKEAKRFWDSWWDQINEARDFIDAATEVTQEERVKYFSTLLKESFNIPKTLSHFEGLFVIRANAWLTKPMYDEGNYAYITGNDYRKPAKWTREGELLRLLITDPNAYIKEKYPLVTTDKEEKQILEKDVKLIVGEKLGLNKKEAISLPTPARKQIENLVSKEIQEDLIVFLNKVNDLPSLYARLNKEEDFAESFVLFVTEPKRLHPLSLYRMKRTLSLSGLYGKPVMTFASVIKKLVKHGYTKEAFQLIKNKRY